MSENSYNSVLSFYAVREQLDSQDNLLERFEELMELGPDEFRCLNIYSFKVSPEQLAQDIQNKRISSELFSDIKKEYQSGASIMYAKPIKGKAIAGFLIEKFLFQYD